MRKLKKATMTTRVKSHSNLSTCQLRLASPTKHRRTNPMVTPKKTALVLMGASGVGKDTYYNMINERYSNVCNAKFTLLGKTLLSNALNAPLSLMDDKDWRNTPLKSMELTPLDLLLALYQGSLHYPPFSKGNIKYTLDSIPPDVFPVFTDVRRMPEAEAICDAYPAAVFIHLRRPDIENSFADHDIERIADVVGAHSVSLVESDNFTYRSDILDFILDKLPEGTLLKPNKPVVNVFSDHRSSLAKLNFDRLRMFTGEYKPFASAMESIAAFVYDQFGCEEVNERVNSAFLSSYLDEGAKVELNIPKHNSFIIWQPAFNSLLPLFREKCRLQIWKNTDRIGIEDIFFDQFSIKEVGYAKLY